MTYILFIIGFVLLLKGADLLVDGASSIAKKFNIPTIVIGLTIVAFGTSLPELVVNLISVSGGNTDLAIGNVLGSNIVNILFILGVTAMVYPVASNRNTVLKEIPFSFLAAVSLFILANDYLIDGKNFSEISRGDGLILLSFFAVFMYYIVAISGGNNSDETEVATYSNTKSLAMVGVGIISLAIGGKWIVDGAIFIASNFGLSESLIGLTIVAIGTSLPELATSVVAALKKNTDIAIGNVVGSNIFNIFFVLAVSAIVQPLPLSSGSIVDLLMTIFVSLILFVVMYIGKRHVVERWQGAAMVFIYIAYLAYLISTK